MVEAVDFALLASYVADHIPVICRYSTTSMGFALRASLWLFKFDPVKFVGSAFAAQIHSG